MWGASEIERRALSTLPRDVEINRPVFADGDGAEVGDLIPADGPSPLDLFRRAELARIVGKLMAEHLTPREERILRQRFGFGSLDILTLDEIGKTLGLSRERVRQIQDEALRKLAPHLVRIFGGEPIEKIRRRPKAEVEPEPKDCFCSTCKSWVDQSEMGGEKTCMVCVVKARDRRRATYRESRRRRVEAGLVKPLTPEQRTAANARAYERKKQRLGTDGLRALWRRQRERRSECI